MRRRRRLHRSRRERSGRAHDACSHQADFWRDTAGRKDAFGADDMDEAGVGSGETADGPTFGRHILTETFAALWIGYLAGRGGTWKKTPFTRLCISAGSSSEEELS
jgi:hypothetical protein